MTSCILFYSLSDGDSGQRDRESIYRRSGTTSQNLHGLLADGVGTALVTRCHVDHKGRERSGQVSPILARNV